MTTQSLSPSKVEKLKEVFGAALRKVNPPDQEAQELIESHWQELEPELMNGFTAALNKVLARFRNMVLLIIPSVKTFVKPDWIKEITKDVPVEPGNYTITFEEFLNEGEPSVKGDEMVRRANASSAIAGLQHAIWLLENQHLIPAEFRGQKYLVFAGTEALDSGDRRRVAVLSWLGDQWSLCWFWLENGSDRHGLLVRARKTK